jgi:cytochrome c biogenesis protein CcmG/thiol:disulfide interchange protein DsbE
VNSPVDPIPPVDAVPVAISDRGGPTRRTWRTPGPRRRIAIAGTAVLVVVVAVALWQGLSKPAATTTSPLVGRTGKPAPPFTLSSLAQGARELSLSSFRGHPLVVNFWASWCIPCRTETPLLEQAYRNEGDRVQFLGIDSNDTTGAARSFVRQVGVTYPVVVDGSGGVAINYDLFGLPTTIFVSSSGTITGRIIGQVHDASTLQAALKEAFHA